MSEQVLQIYMPGFLIVFIWIVVFWHSFKKVMSVYKDFNDRTTMNYKRIKRMHYPFRIILLLFVVMTICFVLFPQYYKLFLPIQALNHPGINMTGFLILKASLIWVLVIQLRLDEALFKYSRNIDTLSSMEVVFFCERLLLKGILLMYIGMFVTISNIIGFILCVIAAFFYYKKR
jgi:protein-S-isoprenylcysteine O-methyltransferase Ste14